jgi:exodeoxyribonuclease VII large subunit
LGVLGKSLERQASIAIRARRDELTRLARTLNAVSPLETIDRGYAVVTRAPGGEVISSVAKVDTGDRITARLKDGELDCTVDTVRQA